MPDLLETVRDWYEDKRGPNGMVNTNTMTCGLVVAGMVRDGLPVSEERLVSTRGSQVRGLGKAAVVKKLHEYGETRTFTSEGGRTSRGSLPLARSLVDLLNGFAGEDIELQLRFPELTIGTDHANAADQQTQRGGDFEIGDTVFHVTVAPGQAVIEKCANNLSSGTRPVLIVPADKVAAAVQLAEIGSLGNRIDVVAAETFIGTSVEEIGEYTSVGVEAQVARLLRVYNQRIQRIEPDQSLQIEVPRWAAQAGAGAGSGPITPAAPESRQR
ncbi:MAG: DUF4928 family protein [Leucobacter sp.]